MNVVKVKEKPRKDISGSMNKRCEQILKELENENKLKVWHDFKFPNKQELKLKLKDMLEDEVDEKYYLTDKQIERILTTSYISGDGTQEYKRE